MNDTQKMLSRDENVKRHVSPDQPLAHLFTLQPSALERIATGRSTYASEMKKRAQGL